MKNPQQNAQLAILKKIDQQQTNNPQVYSFNEPKPERTTYNEAKKEVVQAKAYNAVNFLLSRGINKKDNVLNSVDINRFEKTLNTMQQQNYTPYKNPDGSYSFKKSRERLQKEAEQQQQLQMEQGVMQRDRQLRKLMSGSFTDRLAGTALMYTSGLLSWEDPLSIKSKFYAITGDTDRAIRIKAQAMYDLDSAIDQGTPNYIVKVATGPLATVGTSIATGFGVGAGVGAVKAVYPLAGKATELGIAGVGASVLATDLYNTYQGGNMEEMGDKLLRLGITMPGMLYGYSKGNNWAASKVSSIMDAKGWQPVTFGEQTAANVNAQLQRVNPIRFLRNQWVKSRAEHLPPEELYSPDVLAGKTQLSESPNVKQSMKMFEQAKTPEGLYDVVHTTPSGFPRSGSISMGTSESPGLYVTPTGQGSPYFMKLTGNNSIYTQFGLGLKRGYSTLRFNLNSIIRGPRSVRYSNSRFNQWITGKKPGSWASITAKHEMGGPEIEALIRYDTPFSTNTSGYGWLQSLKGYKQYTTYEGYHIPVRNMQILDSEAMVGGALKFNSTIGSLASSLGRSSPGYSSVFSLRGFGLGSISSWFNDAVSPSYSSQSSQSLDIIASMYRNANRSNTLSGTGSIGGSSGGSGSSTGSSGSSYAPSHSSSRGSSSKGSSGGSRSSGGGSSSISMPGSSSKIIRRLNRGVTNYTPKSYTPSRIRPPTINPTIYTPPSRKNNRRRRNYMDQGWGEAGWKPPELKMPKLTSTKDEIDFLYKYREFNIPTIDSILKKGGITL